MGVPTYLDIVPLWLDMAADESVDGVVVDWLGVRWPEGALPNLPDPSWRGAAVPAEGDGLRAGSTAWAGFAIGMEWSRWLGESPRALDIGTRDNGWALAWVRAARRLHRDEGVIVTRFSGTDTAEGVATIWADQDVEHTVDRGVDAVAPLLILGRGWEVEIHRVTRADAIRAAVSRSGRPHFLVLNANIDDASQLQSMLEAAACADVLVVTCPSRASEAWALAELPGLGLIPLVEEPSRYALRLDGPPLLTDEGEQLWVSSRALSFLQTSRTLVGDIGAPGLHRRGRHLASESPGRSPLQEVGWAYWDVLGRVADAPGASHYAEALKRGHSADELRADLAASSEARIRRKRLQDAQHKLVGGIDIPYTLDVRDGSDRLVVGFSGLGTAPVPPPGKIRELAGDSNSALALGAGPGMSVAPQAARAWSWAAATLITETAAELGIPLSRVVCVGHSFAGLQATWAGLTSGAGQLVTAVPPLRAASAVARLLESTQKDPLTFPIFEFLQLGLEAGGGSLSSVVDMLPEEMAALGANPVHWDIITNKADIFFEDTVQISRPGRLRPSIRIDLHELSFPNHSSVEPVFEQFLRQVLASPVSPL